MLSTALQNSVLYAACCLRPDIIAVGESGSGKTAIAKELKREWKKQSPFHSVYGLIVSENERTLERDIRRLYHCENIPFKDADCQELIRQLVRDLSEKYSSGQQILLVFDDLDGPYAAIMGVLKELYRDKETPLQNIEVIVTTQYRTYSKISAFSSVHVSGFSVEEVRSYLGEYSRTYDLADQKQKEMLRLPVALLAFKGIVKRNMVKFIHFYHQ